MSRLELLYLSPYVLSLLLLGGIFLYAARNHYIRGARTFAWIILGQTLTTAGLIAELVSLALETKLFWDTFQWLASGFLVILPFLIFAFQVSGHQPRSAALIWVILLTFLGVFAALVLTDSIHHLFYQNPRLVPGEPFAELTYDVTPVMFTHLLLYGYGAYMYGIVLIARRAVEPRGGLRLQYLLIAIGFVLPLFFSLASLTDVEIIPQRDMTPPAMAIGSLIAAWGLFRYGLYDISSAAREQLLEDLPDPTVIIDARNRIVELNEAALTFVGKGNLRVVGQTFDIVFAKWPMLINVLKNPFVQKTEISTSSEGRVEFFDIRILHILNHKREAIGRILVMRDITRLKTLEREYQNLFKELEQRVQNRTEELSIIAERYRTIVEKQADLIVRWKPDGTRTFVNEAYCRYWNISYGQALAMNFLFHAASEDRPDVEEKIARLNAGTDTETEVHRVLKPDGTIGWQEWTDTAIRDEWGNLIEIQSIGRDVTERKRAEENLDY